MSWNGFGGVEAMSGRSLGFREVIESMLGGLGEIYGKMLEGEKTIHEPKENSKTVQAYVAQKHVIVSRNNAFCPFKGLHKVM